jgi:hypothetical protein
VEVAVDYEDAHGAPEVKLALMFLRLLAVLAATVAILVLLGKVWIGLLTVAGQSFTDLAVAIGLTLGGLWLLFRIWAPVIWKRR